MRSSARWIVLAVAAFVAGGVAALAIVPGASERLMALRVSTAGTALVGGPFTLTDHTGKTRTDKDFAGRYMLVFFGFTHCPDVCPSGLQVMTEAMERIGTKADRITPVFITVDPERDSTEQMASYVKSFHPRLVGLTGSAEAIADVAKAYRVYFKKIKDASNTDGYTVDHTSIIYLMGPRGEFVSHFTHASPVAAMADALARLP